MPSRRHSISLLGLLLAASAAWAAQPPSLEVYKSPYCGCCEAWVGHLRQNGFQVRVRDVNDVPVARRKLGMPERLGSCHTARLGDYVVEGHVPADDIRRLLKEKPAALGLAVPSMPPGSPGMEGARAVPYETLLVGRDGSTRVFVRH